MTTDLQRVAMAQATLPVRTIEPRSGGQSRITAFMVRNDGLAEDDPAFFYDVEWLAWLEAQFPDLDIVGSMADISEATNNTFLWAVAVR